MPGLCPYDAPDRGETQAGRPADHLLMASFYDDEGGNNARDGLISAAC
jgi:hypothetical protein